MSEPEQSFHYHARARAKVNLHLEVFRKRRDGYHEIETIFQSVNLFDEIDVRFRDDRIIAITCTDPAIPTDKKNLCYRALERMRNVVGDDGLGATIHIKKNIPQRAGLGGGSADAAAVLLATRAHFLPDLPVTDLEEVAAGLGSDVPFMLHGGTMLGQGRGEQLTRMDKLQNAFFLIVKPPVDISTAEVYKSVTFRLTKPRYRINLKAVNSLLSRFPDVTFTFRNALEDVVCPSYPLVAELLDDLIKARPGFASMSGSGSALFAICESEAKASQLAERFSVRGFFVAVVAPSSVAVDLTRST